MNSRISTDYNFLNLQFLFLTGIRVPFLRFQMQQITQVQDYKIERKLGEGSFGEVLLGKNNQGKQVAIKKISKQKVIKVNKLHQPFIQKEILLKLNQSLNNYFIKIQGTHSDDSYVYLILQFCQGGTLDDFIRKSQKIQMKTIQKIIARLVLIMQDFHSKKLIHRDIKPSNILLTKDGFMKLSDFGTCFAPEQFFSSEVSKQIKSIKSMAENKKQEKSRKLSEQDEQSTATSERRYTFVGTACYMAPELLNEDKCGPQSDLWALGCIFYEILHKKSPFFDESEGMVWQKILNGQVKVYEASSEKQVSEEQKNLQSLIKELLVKENQNRLGYGPNGYQNLKSHPFFSGVDWKQLSQNPINQIKIFVNESIENRQLQVQKQQSQKEKVIFSGVVSKKMYFGNYKDRTLVLHSSPKLAYYDTDSGEKKGEIMLSKTTPVKSDGKYFELSTDKKTYYFKSKQSKQWVDMIKLAVLNAFY